LVSAGKIFAGSAVTVLAAAGVALAVHGVGGGTQHPATQDTMPVECKIVPAACEPGHRPVAGHDDEVPVVDLAVADAETPVAEPTEAAATDTVEPAAPTTGGTPGPAAGNEQSAQDQQSAGDRASGADRATSNAEQSAPAGAAPPASAER
jgi:hypothetical protein